jgi:3-oxoacyl-[acyl-carrier-protein] synthase III
MNPLAMMGRNSPLQQALSLKKMLSGQNPAQYAQMLAQRNPQFAQFVQQCQGKSAQQIVQEHGLDWSEVEQLLK